MFLVRCLMKYIVLIPLLIFIFSAQAEEMPVLSNLNSLVWENRVIVINETKSQDKTLQLLRNYEAEIDDRDIIWFMISGDNAVTNYKGQLLRNFVGNTLQRLATMKGKVFLIGKDGGIKSVNDTLDLELIFSEIDAMPMRQYEMHNQ